jgi:hypothetical protein
VAKRQQNQRTPQGGTIEDWEKLSTVGDVRRFLRWLILQAKDEHIDRQLAAVLGQLGCYVLKALEMGGLDAGIAKREQLMVRQHGDSGALRPGSNGNGSDHPQTEEVTWDEPTRSARPLS